MVLVDAPKPGSGKVFDWGLVDDVAEGPRIILADGFGNRGRRFLSQSGQCRKNTSEFGIRLPETLAFACLGL